MSSHRVSSIEEAVKKARELSRECGYNWFRGQVRSFSPVASYYRLDAAKAAEALEQIKHFGAWAKNIRQLDTLSVDELLAIGQHHGLKTPFLDFTTDIEVAAFFACDTLAPPPEGQLSRIYLLNTSDFSKFFSDINAHDSATPIPEYVTPQLPDLWRLNAQQGVFLFMGGCGWENYYALDYIEFPYTGIISSPTRATIYPSRSTLETLLDRFFIVDRDRQNQPKIDLLRKTFAVINFSPECENIYVPEHESWQDVADEWHPLTGEPYSVAARSFTLPITIDLTRSCKLIRDRVSNGVLSLLAKYPSARPEAASWQVAVIPNLPNNCILPEMFINLWDGIRLLPYENRDVAESLGVMAALFAAGYGNAQSLFDERAMQAAEQVLDVPFPIAFTARDSATGMAFISLPALVRSLRSDLADVLSEANIPYDAFQDDKARLARLFRQKPDPRVLFDFTTFANEFVRSVIPCEIVGNQWRKQPVLFSSAELIIFGQP